MIEQATTKRKHISFDEAWLYCATCTHNGKYDWRMPTRREHDRRVYRPLKTNQWNDEGYHCWEKRRVYVTPVRTKDD
jgi:hypothetical protein